LDDGEVLLDPRPGMILMETARDSKKIINNTILGHALQAVKQKRNSMVMNAVLGPAPGSSSAGLLVAATLSELDSEGIERETLETARQERIKYSTLRVKFEAMMKDKSVITDEKLATFMEIPAESNLIIGDSRFYIYTHQLLMLLLLVTCTSLTCLAPLLPTFCYFLLPTTYYILPTTYYLHLYPSHTTSL
jgi:hypothetical protein